MFSAVVICVLASSLVSSVCAAGPYGEAPMLRKLVEEGKLPPVEERLPDQPSIVRPYEKVGVYGGQMNTVTGMAGILHESQYMVYEPLLRFASDGTTIVPNVVTRWEMGDDSRSITLYLRKGMRWSDGVPVTVDDVLFAWYDVFLNEDLNVRAPSAFVVAGEPMEIQRMDDYTFRLVFKEPYGSVPYFLTRTMAWNSLIQPKHYLKAYHPKYTPRDKIMTVVNERDFTHWFELFKDVNHTQRSLNNQTPPDYPTISAWRVASVPSTGHVILERNPYYWKVDPEGNQLPYIDRIHSTYVGNPEARNLTFVTGDIDFGGSYTRFEDSPLFLSNRKKGRYSVYFWEENQGSRVAYFFNQTHPDPVLRKIFQDRRFRAALSLAINRQEINDIVYFGKCRPRQLTVNPTCSFLEPEFEKSYADYNPEEAGRLLDQVGLHTKPGGHWRYLPDGRQLVIACDVYGIEPYRKTTELVKEHWGAVGVLLNWRVAGDSLIWIRVSGNEAHVFCTADDVATDVMVLNEPLYGVAYWAPLWSRWLGTEGKHGEAPPRTIRDLYRMWEDLRATGDPQERVRLGKGLIRSQADNLWGIGTVGGTLNPIVVSRRLHNVPQYMKDSNGDIVYVQDEHGNVRPRLALWGWPWLATFLHHPEQFYIEQE